MVYFVSGLDPYVDPVHSEFLDAPNDNAFGGVTYEADPATLDLNALEREFLGKGRGAMENGYRVVGDKAPKKLLWEGGDKPLPEVILRNSLAVSSRFRDLVDEFEPGLHQFFPVDVYKTRDGEVSATYYWINVCNRIESVDPDRTTYIRKKDYTGKGFWSRSGVEDAKLVFSISRVGGRHLWMDPDLPSQRHFYASNAFAGAAASANFLGLILSERDEV